MKRITVYTPEELKRKNPKAFDKAHERFSSNEEIPWQDEIMDSLKAVFKASGINLRDWNIDGNWPSYSWVTIGFLSYNNDDVNDLKGPRAMAWLENNLLADLRIPFSPMFINFGGWQLTPNRGALSKYGSGYRAGMIKPCPFTGYCADEDFIESLINDIKAGETLGEAYHNLAQVAGRLFQLEIEYANSEERFLEQEHLQFTADGRMI